MKGDEKMKTENNPDYDRKKLEAKKKMARNAAMIAVMQMEKENTDTRDDLKTRLYNSRDNVRRRQQEIESIDKRSRKMIGKEKVLPAIDRIPCFEKKFGNSVNMSMKRMEEKTIENIMRKTENYEMYEIDEQNIVLTNDEFAKENNPLALYVRKYRI